MYTAVQLEFADPLTDAGGTIPLIPGSCSICAGPDFDAGSTVSGSGFISYNLINGGGSFEAIDGGEVTAAPEPGFGACIAVCLLSMAGIRRYRTRCRKSAASSE